MLRDPDRYLPLPVVAQAQQRPDDGLLAVLLGERPVHHRAPDGGGELGPPLRAELQPAVAGEVETLGKEVRRRLAGIEGAVAALGRNDAQGTGAGHAGAGPSRGGADEAEAGASGQGRKPPSKPSMRREHPDLVTREPAPDDEEIFGEAWPLIVEWRGLKDAHPNEGKGLDWLVAQERLLELELALLEEHGMTLPPEKQPLRGLDRSGQTSWRRTALYDTRRARAQAELLRKVRRVVTFGLWRR